MLTEQMNQDLLSQNEDNVTLTLPSLNVPNSSTEETEKKRGKRKKECEEMPVKKKMELEWKPEDCAQPIGEVSKLSGKGKKKKCHYKTFKFHDKQYGLEDSVLLVPEDAKLKLYVAIIKDIYISKKETSTSSIIPDWSLLPDELLHLISTHLHNCFDVVHARSVCRSWRSTFPFPSSLLRHNYSLPSFREYSDLCTLEKVPLFLFRVPSPAAANDVSPSEYFLGEIRQDDHMELQSPLQCSVRVKIPRTEPTLMNILDCQIIPLGHQYRIIGSEFNCVAFLPLDKEGKRGEFVVLLSYSTGLRVLTSAEMRWKRLENVPDSSCLRLVTYRGRFYATFKFGKIVVIDPYSLEVTLLLLPQPREQYMVALASGKDELFLVERLTIPRGGVLKLSGLAFRVSRLDEEAGKWVVVSDLGDRLLFIGKLRNASCSAKELPHGCGLSGNSILLLTNLAGKVYFTYKYGVHT